MLLNSTECYVEHELYVKYIHQPPALDLLQSRKRTFQACNATINDSIMKSGAKLNSHDTNLISSEFLIDEFHFLILQETLMPYTIGQVYASLLKLWTGMDTKNMEHHLP